MEIQDKMDDYVRSLKDVPDELKSKVLPERIGSVKDYVVNPEAIERLPDAELLVVYSDTPNWGWYNHDNGKVYINARTANSFDKAQETLTHELIHNARRAKGRAFDRSLPYDDRVFEISARKGSQHFRDSLMTNLKSFYESSRQ